MSFFTLLILNINGEECFANEEVVNRLSLHAYLKGTSINQDDAEVHKMHIVQVNNLDVYCRNPAPVIIFFNNNNLGKIAKVVSPKTNAPTDNPHKPETKVNNLLLRLISFSEPQEQCTLVYVSPSTVELILPDGRAVSFEADQFFLMLAMISADNSTETLCNLIKDGFAIRASLRPGSLFHLYVTEYRNGVVLGDHHYQIDYQAIDRSHWRDKILIRNLVDRWNIAQARVQFPI